MYGVILAFSAAQMPVLPSPCPSDVPTTSSGTCSITAVWPPPLPAIGGPAWMCSKHFSIKLKPGDQLSVARLNGSVRFTITNGESTIHFGEESFRENEIVPMSSMRWRRDVLHRTVAGSTGMPYSIADASGRYVIQNIDGSAFHGDVRDLGPLSRFQSRGSQDRCDAYLDLGNLSYADEPR